MKVVLLNPPSEPGYIRSGRWTRKSRANQQWYPLWLGYATALLQREGYECLLLDASVEELTEHSTLIKLATFKPDYIIYYWSYDTHKQDLSFADTCAKIAEVVLVGPWSFCLPDALELTKNVYLMTYGEFEHTLLEIVDGKSCALIDGLVWKVVPSGEIIKNQRRQLCSNKELDDIPFVTRVYAQFLDIDKYHQTSLKFPFVDLQSSRGCPNRCTYCCQTRAMQRGSSYRSRSVKNVIEELWWITHNLPEVKQIFLQDEAIVPRRAVELSRAIIDENLNICWGGLSRADLSYETLKLMEESGCRTLQVGFETPIQRYLDIIHKDITVERYEQFCQDINKTKIWNNAAFMIFPWHISDEVKFTVKWAKKMKIDRLSFIRAQAYPNTPYEKTLEDFSERYKLMTVEEITKLENWAHKQYYLRHPWMWWRIIKDPANWPNVVNDAKGLLKSLR